MQNFVVQNEARTRRASAFGCWVNFSRRPRLRSRDRYREPVQWFKQKYPNHETARKAAEHYVETARVLGVPKRRRGAVVE